MPVNRFGYPLLYPPKPGGFVYEQSDDITKDQYFNAEGHVSNSSGGQWTMSTSGPDAVQIGKNSTTADAIGGCGMSFKQCVSRGYEYKVYDSIYIVLMFAVKFVDSGSDNCFAFEGPTSSHSSSGCCSGNCYKVDIQYRPSQPVFRFRKEMWHVDNTDDPNTGQFTSSTFNFQLLGHSTYVAFAYVRYNKANGALPGHNTTDSVVLEFWGNVHPDTSPLDWILIKRTEDRGGWGNSGDQCDGDKDQISTWAGQKFRLKSNDSSGEFQFKNLSLLEIDPNGNFDDNPDTPPPPDQPPDPTTVQGQFKLQWNVNTIGASSCQGAGTGGGGGNTVFWLLSPSHGKELSDSSTFQNRTRIGELLKSSSSLLYNKITKQIDVPLMKVGTPGASPTVHCKIWNSSGAVVYDSPTTIDPSTLTTSFPADPDSWSTFDFSTNTHALVVGDYIGVEWTGTSDTAYVMAAYDDDASSNTVAVYAIYESGSLDEKPSRDFCARIWQ